MDFKNKIHFEKLDEVCPPVSYKSKFINPVYRWIFDVVANEVNFMPLYFKDPIRLLNKNDVEKCQSLGLSFFEDLELSKKRFEELKKIIGYKVYKTLGNKIAQGTIFEKDGVNSDKGYLSHFTHHSAQNANYVTNFKLTNFEL